MTRVPGLAEADLIAGTFRYLGQNSGIKFKAFPVLPINDVKSFCHGLREIASINALLVNRGIKTPQQGVGVWREWFMTIFFVAGILWQ